MLAGCLALHSLQKIFHKFESHEFPRFRACMASSAELWLVPRTRVQLACLPARTASGSMPADYPRHRHTWSTRPLARPRKG